MGKFSLCTAFVALFSLSACSNIKGSTSSIVQCFTTYSNKAPPGGVAKTQTFTSSSLTTSTVTHVKTSTIKSTPTPAYSTIIHTTFETATVTQSTQTDVAFSTSTSVISAVTSITSTATENDSTTITTTSTSTIDTVQGFTPLASNAAVIADGGASKKLKRREDSKKQLRDLVGARSPNPAHIHLDLVFKKGRYIYSVQCFEAIYEVKTAVQASTTSVTKEIPQKTLRVTASTKITTTTTLTPPDATTTSTIIVSSTNTVTSSFSTTTTIVATSTVQADTVATAYAACQADNLVHKVGDRYVGGTSAYSANMDFSSQNEIDCCNLCQSTSCSGFQWVGFYCLAFGPAPASSCDPSVSGFTIYSNDQPNGVVQTMGNGPCGHGDLGN